MTEHVKIYGVKPRIQYTADGTLTTYEFPFAVFSASDIDVYLGSTKQSASSYTVSGVRYSTGGSVTFGTAPTSGTIITIIRNLSIERSSDFQEGGALRADTLNDELDYQIACQQQIAENLNRSMVLPPYATDSNVDLTLPTPSAGKAIVWNSDATNLENSTIEVNALESTIKGYKTAAENAAATATEKAGIASDKADVATSKAAEAVATLADKAGKDMDNISATGKATVVGWGVPDYTSAVSITSPYTAPSDGYLLVNSASGYPQGQTALISINDVNIAGATWGVGYIERMNAVYPVSKNDVITYTNLGGGMMFCPCKGV